MRKTILASVAIMAGISILLSCGGSESKSVAVAEISHDSLVKRGEYLVTIMGCNDCHTPMKMTEQGPAPDMDRLLSGYPSQLPVGKVDTTVMKQWVMFGMGSPAAVGPWGISFPANLTSDETGIGSWTEAQFKKALTEGKFKGQEGTRPLLPPMPWQNYVNIKDEDVKAIFAFLKSTKPVNNVVPNAVPPTELKKYL